MVHSTTFIYALCEPNSRSIRYIGKSWKPEKRLREHVTHSIKAKTHLGCWLRLLASQNQLPDLVTLCEVPDELGASAEIFHIKLARDFGMELVNSTDGGEGMSNPSEITRKKLSAAGTGRKHTEETKAKQREGKLGSKNPNFGKPMTETAKINLSLGWGSSKGRITSPETRVKISEAKKSQGLKASTEARGNLSLRWGPDAIFSKSHREALSAAAKAAHARRKAAKA